MKDYGLVIKKAYQKNFKKFGPTILKECVYSFIGDTTHVPGSTTVTKATPQTQPLTVLFDKIEESLIDEHNILSIDRVALFPSLDITIASELQSNDLIIENISGKVWVVKKVKTDPANAGYELFVRPQIPL